LIRVCYVGVCSTDLEVAAGGLDYYKSGWAKYPIVPGHEFSGVVAAKGSRVERLKIGDKVVGECILGCGECDYCLRDMPLRCQQRKELGVLNFDGAYSKYLTMPERFVHCLPAHTQLSLACLIEPLAVSLKGIGKLVAGDNGTFKKVAILGYGTIGNLCAQIMCGRGHSVVVFDKNELRVANIKNKRIKGNTQIRGLGDFDYIVEATGQVEVLKQALSETKAGAKLLLLGLPYASLDFNFESVVSFDKTLIGSLGSSREDFLAAIKNHSTLEFEGLARDIFPLKDYALAWAKQKEGKVAKAIIKIGET
ncbi:MAG: alcohol dehydrogenase catalytic domain-containing protein, partial [Candidatus Saganbacteria bacterium]|nr:alcohol dehydrogenase catalytic domain-containing protein [Candidatus Saganbacteria bacterium]